MSQSVSESRIVATRYVRALFDLSQADKTSGQVEKDLNAFVALLDESPLLEKQLTSPVVDKKGLAAAVDALLAKLSASDLTRKFFRVLAANQRLSVVREVAQQFTIELASARGEVLAEVTSAHALAAEQKAEIEASLKKATGKVVNVAYLERPEILGGLILKVGGKMIDNSVLGKIEKLRVAMKAGARA